MNLDCLRILWKFLTVVYYKTVITVVGEDTDHGEREKLLFINLVTVPAERNTIFPPAHRRTISDNTLREDYLY